MPALYELTYQLYHDIQLYLDEHSSDEFTDKEYEDNEFDNEMNSGIDGDEAESESSSGMLGENNSHSGKADDVVDISKITKEVFKESLIGLEKRYSNPELEKIITEFINSKKVRQSGGAVNAYSGIINPRDCHRKDYKWWLKNNLVGSVNKFDKVTLNLFVDISGSFCCSEQQINCIIKELNRCSNMYKDFEFNLVSMGMKNQVRNRHDLEVMCAGGNNLDTTIFDAFRRVQTPNTTVYNIVVFDGDAFSDCYPIDYSVMKVFNSPNTIIISDIENEPSIVKYSPRSKNIIVRSNYANELENNIIKTLKQFCK